VERNTYALALMVADAIAGMQAAGIVVIHIAGRRPVFAHVILAAIVAGR
jgi:hypothetical protein